MKSMALILTFLLTSIGFAKDVETVASVDLQKYLGKWYEVASIPQSFQKQCVGNTTAEYSLAEGDLIKVINSCDTAKGDRDVAEGRARVVDKTTNSKLEVTFVHLIDWIFAFGGKYWVLDVDQEYSYAVVGDPTRKYAWILSRTPTLETEKWHKAIAVLKGQGYDTCKVLVSIQDQGEQIRRPLCL